MKPCEIQHCCLNIAGTLLYYRGACDQSTRTNSLCPTVRSGVESFAPPNALTRLPTFFVFVSSSRAMDTLAGSSHTFLFLTCSSSSLARGTSLVFCPLSS